MIHEQGFRIEVTGGLQISVHWNALNLVDLHFDPGITALICRTLLWILCATGSACLRIQPFSDNNVYGTVRLCFIVGIASMRFDLLNQVCCEFVCSRIVDSILGNDFEAYTLY